MFKSNDYTSRTGWVVFIQSAILREHALCDLNKVNYSIKLADVMMRNIMVYTMYS